MEFNSCRVVVVLLLCCLSCCCRVACCRVACCRVVVVLLVVVLLSCCSVVVVWLGRQFKQHLRKLFTLIINQLSIFKAKYFNYLFTSKNKKKLIPLVNLDNSKGSPTNPNHEQKQSKCKQSKYKPSKHEQSNCKQSQYKQNNAIKSPVDTTLPKPPSSVRSHERVD